MPESRRRGEGGAGGAGAWRRTRYADADGGAAIARAPVRTGPGGGALTRPRPRSSSSSERALQPEMPTCSHRKTVETHVGTCGELAKQPAEAAAYATGRSSAVARASPIFERGRPRLPSFHRQERDMANIITTRWVGARCPAPQRECGPQGYRVLSSTGRPSPATPPTQCCPPRRAALRRWGLLDAWRDRCPPIEPTCSTSALLDHGSPGPAILRRLRPRRTCSTSAA